jgi:DNA (cytosine-5)-methyltransferase 1
MNYLSVCSGIEAATVGWHSLGWQPVAFSEIEKFPCSALAHHYPDVPNWGDMTKFKEWPDANVDVLVGGTPCQSFSVAGLRKGLADPRGNLMLTYLAIADRYRPTWLVWENVPGVLSSNGGRDFASLLRGLAELGYGFAYRILDAQHFGVPQRRRRVFVVGHLGDWRRAAAVLFERHSMQGHPAPSRETGKRVAASLRTRAPGSGGQGTDFEQVVANTIPAHPGICAPDLTNYVVWPATVAPTLDAHYGDKMGLENQHINSGDGLFVAHTLRGDGFDASEDGTGRGTPLVPVAFDTTQITSPENGSNPQPGDPCHPLAAGAHPPAIAYSMITANTGANELGVAAEVAPTLDRAQPCAVAAFKGGQGSGAGSIGYSEHLAPTLPSADGGNRTPTFMQAMQVRRLTPKECARLQGFPDDYLDVLYRGKPAADGPRYKALGNSMAVPVMAWIGKRIQQVESI